MPVMQFDFEKQTADDVKTILPGLRAARMESMAAMVAAFAVQCPTEWGAPDKADTYSEKPFREVLAVAWKEFGDAQKSLPDKIEGFEFDLEQVTPKEFDTLTRDLESNNPEKMADVLVKFVRKLPKGWGDPSKKETYLRLKYYTQFLPLARALMAAGREELNAFLKLLTSD